MVIDKTLFSHKPCRKNAAEVFLAHLHCSYSIHRTENTGKFTSHDLLPNFKRKLHFLCMNLYESSSSSALHDVWTLDVDTKVVNFWEFASIMIDGKHLANY